MRVFYHGNSRQPDVAANAAWDRSLEQALHLFAGINRSGNFLGIYLDDRHVLQFRCEEGSYRTEVLDTQLRTIEYCILSCPLAEEVIRQAFEGGDFRRVATESFIHWQQQSLSPDSLV